MGERVHTTTWSTLLGCGATHTTPTSPPAVVCARAHTLSAAQTAGRAACQARPTAWVPTSLRCCNLSSVRRRLCRQSVTQPTQNSLHRAETHAA